ncbi:3-dehydroquinate synthase [Aequitasia blattaphilus]|uniref:3-dehydroquinate synthase n=1 Tax=Aequitasia blattaphilus TaxID=2949332 RepID=A0ABT1E5L6_9FIRM|nr:3-dehydroquinate synthase [Aequitasia blattaphilus]MCP1100869.1 3-dehydroquinate synthase [Aequitasia blattaphilus]MCR8613509.1 3-dehydroquinate synthase [Aequitasia blattaphilus]
MEILVNLGKDSYPIYIENNLISQTSSHIQKIFSGKRIFLLSDDNVYPLYGASIQEDLSHFYECHHLILPHGEATKSFQSLPVVYEALINSGISRSDLIIALGGGVIGDLAGYVAASYLRGIDFIQIPTSLLAQVDSSVGGKVAVDLPQGKNLVGAFYQPKLVLIDPEVLSTLSPRFIKDGMGEVIKYGCIQDASLFQLLEESGSFEGLKPRLMEVIFRCIQIKTQVVEADPFDKGQRMLLNFGHTLAHAIEQFYGYKRESHGEAVAIGMYQLTCLAEEKCLTQPGSAEKILNLLSLYELPHKATIPIGQVLPALSLDKKMLHNQLNLVLLKSIGESYIYPTDTEFFQSVYNKII